MLVEKHIALFEVPYKEMSTDGMTVSYADEAMEMDDDTETAVSEDEETGPCVENEALGEDERRQYAEDEPLGDEGPVA